MHSPKLKLTVLLVSSLTIMSMITISPALPEISAHFANVPNGEFLVKLMLTLPALFIALVSPIAGRLADKYGRLKLLYGSMILYALAGTTGYYLENLYMILAGRAFLGIAVGISMTIVNTLVADYFEGQERQKFVGIQVAFMSLGGILFIGLGGFLADMNWRFPFLIYLFSLLILPMSLLYLYEPELPKRNTSEARIKSPSIIWWLFINTMIMWIIFFLIPVQLPFFLQSIGVESNTMIGMAVALSTLFSAISSFSFSKISKRASPIRIFALGYFMLAASYAIIANSASYIMVVVAMMVAGLGMGMMIPNTNLWVMRIAPPEIRGREIGRLTTFWFMGQFLSPIILQPVSQVTSIPNTFLFMAFLLLALSFIFLALLLRPARASV